MGRELGRKAKKMARTKQMPKWTRQHGRREPRKTPRPLPRRPAAAKISQRKVGDDIPEEKGDVPDGSGSELESEEIVNEFPARIGKNGWCIYRIVNSSLLKKKTVKNQTVLTLTGNRFKKVEVHVSQTIICKKTGQLLKETWTTKLSRA